MFDTMTFTKIAGGLCGALLVFLLGKWAAEEMYHVEAHGDAAGYVIEVAEAETADAPAGGVSFDEVLATADASKGANVFKKCSACHKLEQGANGVGPHLYGIVGREIAAVDGFGYSDALKGKGEAWTPENLNGFLEKPSNWAPGTVMGFAGLKKVEDRANLIAYLDTIGN